MAQFVTHCAPASDERPEMNPFTDFDVYVLEEKLIFSSSVEFATAVAAATTTTTRVQSKQQAVVCERMQF